MDELRCGPKTLYPQSLAVYPMSALMLAVGKERMVGHVIVTAVWAVILPFGDMLAPLIIIAVMMLPGIVYNSPRLANRITDLSRCITADSVPI